MTLESELTLHRQKITTDSYPMSISEIANLYRDGEMDIHPEFQRIFRWSNKQRTQLIESILLGIPLPSIFVAQSEAGIWDVVDGVQRLSTIFQFMGILRDEQGNLVPPLVCDAAPFLSSLEGMTYDSAEGAKGALTRPQQLDFKRSRIDIKIIKRESDKRAKYDLFQRLNSLGSAATPQELRSCLLVSLSRAHFDWLRDIANSENFQNVLNLPGRLINEQYHLELALRFVTLRALPEQRISAVGNIGDFLSAEILPFSEKDSSELRSEQDVFESCFALLNDALGSDAMRKWNPSRSRTEGAFSSTAFEVLALGLGHYMPRKTFTVNQVREARERLWSDPQFSPGFATGRSADQRMKETIPYGRRLFSV
ncbi:DUF262 domain-containing protein [Streptomyces sp. B1866]|uniref:DUF262 domain-containing protein n=1 Tax=Streptomyces sp. B1866 TaxID=3075431 RepID=UPI002891E02D|nr:DUF262 domain-containing protein [Streptomyces sp. B1866]MDT3395234.1 DUF262 domain-containing protein [Streptomyces sp. B1866]